MIFIAIVSHGHDELIMANKELLKIAQLNGVKVAIKDNIKSDVLKAFCLEHQLEYQTTRDMLGFGANNNHLFGVFKKKLNAKPGDWFICMNPDVEMDIVNFKVLADVLNAEKDENFFTINLFKDADYQTSEDSVRYFPSFSNLFNAVKSKPVNLPYDKAMLRDRQTVDWASGAFLCLTSRLVDQTNGFDERYFMYYEDVDICFRAKKAGFELKYLADIKAVHSGAYANRRIFSPHFKWYFSSLFRFLLTKSL